MFDRIFETIVSSLGAFGLTPETLSLAGLASGAVIMVLGVAGTFAGTAPEVRRMRAGLRRSGGDSELLSRGDTDPKGILRAFVPTSEIQRTRLSLRMRQAGIQRGTAVRDFYVARALLGVLLPTALLIVALLPADAFAPAWLTDFTRGTDRIRLLQYLAALVLLGFYGPELWLRRRIKARQAQIENGMPNALDLLQVSIEAGMGFDAAMNRVAHELARVVPPIAEEFMIVQLELQSGKERDRAFSAMAARTGVDEMNSFVNVVLQSAQFGTSVSAALQTYADEMRMTRELRAQERANKLPVKMSAVMAALMMPTLLMITLTPVVIRWIRMFPES